jgi:hypothetical protein
MTSSGTDIQWWNGFPEISLKLEEIKQSATAVMWSVVFLSCLVQISAGVPAIPRFFVYLLSTSRKFPGWYLDYDSISSFRMLSNSSHTIHPLSMLQHHKINCKNIPFHIRFWRRSLRSSETPVFTGLKGVISQGVQFFLATAVRTSNLKVLHSWIFPGASVVGWGTMLQAGRSLVRVPTRSLDIFNLILPAAL